MGDGRYYSALQFFNTLILLLLLMLITVNLVTILYKQISRKMSNWFIALYSGLWVTIILRLAEEVVVGPRTVVLFNHIGQWLLITICLGILWALGALFRKTLEPTTSITQTYGTNELLKVWGIFLLPSIFYGIVILMNQPWVNYYQLFYYGILAYSLNRLLTLIVPYEINLTLFTHTKDMILDYVFITDVKGTVIFQNNNSETDSYFNSMKVLDYNNIAAIFNRQVEHQKLRGKDYIKYEGQDSPIYFSYSIKELLRRGTAVGAIITFTDVTGLMLLLEDLDQRNGDKKRINQELQQYATIVYRLEKEKEIQQLLESIAQNQEKSMLLLKDEIHKTLQLETEESFIENLEVMILSAKENLHDVRTAVSTYKTYYRGQDD